MLVGLVYIKEAHSVVYLDIALVPFGIPLF